MATKNQKSKIKTAKVKKSSPLNLIVQIRDQNSFAWLRKDFRGITETLEKFNGSNHESICIGFSESDDYASPVKKEFSLKHEISVMQGQSDGSEISYFKKQYGKKGPFDFSKQKTRLQALTQTEWVYGTSYERLEALEKIKVLPGQDVLRAMYAENLEELPNLWIGGVVFKTQTHGHLVLFRGDDNFILDNMQHISFACSKEGWDQDEWDKQLDASIAGYIQFSKIGTFGQEFDANKILTIEGEEFFAYVKKHAGQSLRYYPQEPEFAGLSLTKISNYAYACSIAAGVGVAASIIYFNFLNNDFESSLTLLKDQNEKTKQEATNATHGKSIQIVRQLSLDFDGVIAKTRHLYQPGSLVTFKTTALGGTQLEIQIPIKKIGVDIEINELRNDLKQMTPDGCEFKDVFFDTTFQSVRGKYECKNQNVDSNLHFIANSIGS